MINMCYINHIDSLSIHSSVSAQNSSGRTCPGFDPVTSLYFFLHSDRAMKDAGEIALFLAIKSARLTDSTIYYYG